jgi:Kef-type K+ transport system membrane component KefB
VFSFDALAQGNQWLIAAVWMILATVGAFIAVRISLAAALVEIVLGVLGGFFLGLHSNAWIDFIAGFGSIMLTFLAGGEIDPVVLRSQLRESATLGAVSFFAPAIAAFAFALLVLHWSLDGAKIAAIAMSTTSVAVVYAVMVESGLAGTRYGQLILSACFITDLGTVVALGLLFSNYNGWLVALVVGIALTMWSMPRLLPIAIAATGDRVSEPAIRALLTVILTLSALATFAHSEGVLPAYFLGLGCAGFLAQHRDVMRRLRSTAMTFLTPFYFLKAGTLVSLPQAIAGGWFILGFFVIKVAAKILGVWPAARFFHYRTHDAGYLTMMMATGLTFGTISSLYGLTHHYIDQAQYTVLVTVVILTAVVPTLVAQAVFKPRALVALEAAASESDVA